MLSKSDVQKIASLAKLELTDEELNKYADQISQILNYINQLNEIDAEGIEPASQVTGLTNVFREDKIEKSAVIDDLLAQAPETENGGVKVKSVF